MKNDIATAIFNGAISIYARRPMSSDPSLAVRAATKIYKESQEVAKGIEQAMTKEQPAPLHLTP